MKRIRLIPFAILVLGILLIVFMRLHMGIVRYFDPDEFAHMHWAWLVFKGNVPYRDFFFYNFPLYQWLMAPIFLIPEGPVVLTAIRLWQMALYLGSVVLLYRIARRDTGSRFTALLASLIFLAFPMTFDKTVDVRPDMVMILLMLLAIDIIGRTKQITHRHTFLAGFLLSLSALIIPKVIFALPAVFTLILIRARRLTGKMIAWGVAGGLGPVALFLLYLLCTGALGAAMTAIFSDSIAVNAGKTGFSPWKALSPWPLVYLGRGGVSFPWQVNTGIWIASLAGFLWFFAIKPAKGLFYAVYYAAGILFVFLFPAPYLQYFLPLSVFAAFFAALFIERLIHTLSKTSKAAHLVRVCFTVAVTGILVASFRTQYLERVAPGGANDEQMQVIRDVVAHIPEDQTVYDMVGSYVFRPDGYIFCCHPYQEFVDRLGRPFPTLKESLAASGTKYLILDRTGMSLWQPKPNDLAFLKANYLESRHRKIYVAGKQFRCDQGACFQYGIDSTRLSSVPTADITLPIGGNYEVEVSPPTAKITINGRSYGSGEEIPVSPGAFRFAADDAVTHVVIRLAH